MSAHCKALLGRPMAVQPLHHLHKIHVNFCVRLFELAWLAIYPVPMAVLWEDRKELEQGCAQRRGVQRRNTGQKGAQHLQRASNRSANERVFTPFQARCCTIGKGIDYLASKFVFSKVTADSSKSLRDFNNCSSARYWAFHSCLGYVCTNKIWKI